MSPALDGRTDGRNGARSHTQAKGSHHLRTLNTCSHSLISLVTLTALEAVAARFSLRRSSAILRAPSWAKRQADRRARFQLRCGFKLNWSIELVALITGSRPAPGGSFSFFSPAPALQGRRLDL